MDTTAVIIAVASPPGRSARGIVRLSGALDGALLDTLHRARREGTVGHRSQDAPGSLLLQNVGGLRQGAGRDREVVHDQGGLALHTADQLQHFGALIV